MSIDFNGNLYDYFTGEKDLGDKIVRFIGSPDQRIQEDYLRILRFFRFSCFYGQKIDDSGFIACIKNKNQIVNLSCERIKEEFLKIISCKNRDNLWYILSKMQEAKILELVIQNKLNLNPLSKLPITPTISHQARSICSISNNTSIHSASVPTSQVDLIQSNKTINDPNDGFKPNLNRLKNLLKLEKILNCQFDNIMILSTLCANPKINLSKTEKNYLKSITNPKFIVNFKLSTKDLFALLLNFNQKIILDAFIFSLISDKNLQLFIDDFLRIYKIITTAKIPNFIINGHDLININIPPKNIGKTLKQCQKYWLDNKFLVNKQQILKFILDNPRNIS